MPLSLPLDLPESPATSLMNSGPLTAPPPPKPKDPPQMRSFGDAAATRQFIYEDTLAAARNLAPLENDKHRLRLSDVDWVDPERFSRKQRKEAILRGETLSRRMKGTWTLEDVTTGNVLQQRPQVVARVPYLSSMGTFTHKGNEYTVNHQQRLQPGIFARIKENGELESHVNILPGDGVSHRYFLDPAKGIFKIRLRQAEMPLLPLLHQMGATDQEVRDSWGNELYAQNYKHLNSGGTIKKLAERLLRKTDQVGDDVQIGQRLKETVENMKLDPEVTKRTLGHPYANLTKEAILAATKKLLDVSRGTAEPDDRDHLAYQTIVGPEDLFSERLRRDHGNLRKQLFRKISRAGSLDKMPTGALTPQIEQVLLGSGLANALEEINPAEVLDKQSRITRMGEGGIPCYSSDTEVLTSVGWKDWPTVQKTDLLACTIDGQLQFHMPTTLYAKKYHGLMFGLNTKRVAYLITPDHRVWAQKATSGFQTWTPWKFWVATDVHDKVIRLKTAVDVAWEGDVFTDTFVLPPAPVEKSNRGSADRDSVTLPICAWAEFLGAYLADGSFAYALDRKEYRVEIGKTGTKNPAEKETIERILRELPFTWCYEQDRRFIISGKALAYYVKQFGHAANKFVPEYILRGAVDVRRAFFEVMTHHDCSGWSKHSRRYASASKQLRDDVAFIAISLGYAVTYYELMKADQNAQYGVLIKYMKSASASKQKKGEQYSREKYDGMVYCAAVPGQLLLVRRNGKVHWSGNSLDSIPTEARAVQPSHLGFLDPIRTPESMRVGIDLQMANAARKGRDGRVYTQLQDKQGKMVYRSPQDISDASVATTDVMSWDTKRVPVMKGGKLTYVPKAEVDYVLPSFENSFSHLGNLVPLKSMVKGQRVAMASRMLTQALPLVNAESPLVQNALPGSNGTRSFEDEYGKHLGAIHAEQGGRVERIDTKDGIIHVSHDDGTRKEIELYQNFPFNRKTSIHQTPTVRVGETFRPGQLLARSNYTDEKGSTALGLNARVAYMAWKGYNFEDAQVISESLAKRLSSEHAYQHGLEVTDRHKMGKKSFIGLFPTKFDNKILDSLDDLGIVRPGQIVEHGQPLILAAKERDRADNKIHKKRQAGYNDESVLWQHHDPGMVTDVVHGKHGPVVLIKSVSQMQVGDKLAGRYGNKGVVSAIVPDLEMPHSQDGKPFEILLNPLGTISRTNPAQHIESQLGKIATKIGHPVKVSDFENQEDMTAWTQQLLKQHGLSDVEDISIPDYPQKVPNVQTGHNFFMKLHHTAESKSQGRGGGGYSADDTPSKGGAQGSKRISGLDTNALLSHGAIETLRDARLIRGSKREKFWLDFMQGYKPEDPSVPLTYEKFINQLKSAGVDVVRKGSQTQLMPLTDAGVDKLAEDRRILHGDTVHFDHDLRPVVGGLFDTQQTGGHGGKRWSAIDLPEPMPNPVMEEPIRHILGLTQKKFGEVISGDHHLEGFGTGPKAIQAALEAVNIDRDLQTAKGEYQHGRASSRDQALRKWHHLNDAKKLGMHPKDWMLSKVPVLPPAYRPVSIMGDSGIPLVADPNYLYKELLESIKNHQAMKTAVGEEGIGPERSAVYHAFKAVTGLGDPVHPKLQEKNVKGVLKTIFGTSPKYGTVQRKLISTPVDNVGRAVITPNPDYDVDTVGIPENQAFNVYSKFVVRRLKRRGMPVREALRHVKDKTDLAREAIQDEMTERPVFINRAPVLHRFGILAFKPKLVKGDVMQISPLVVKGFNADFDGDAMQFHVPTTDEAIKEAYDRMLPSKNLLSPADFKTPVHMPSKEYLGGAFFATDSHQTSKRPPRYFRSKQDALASYERGEISANDRVVVLEP